MVSNYRELPMLFRSTKVKVHSDSNKEKPQPKVIITDELGNVFEPDPVTGVLHRTDGRVTIPLLCTQLSLRARVSKRPPIFVIQRWNTYPCVCIYIYITAHRFYALTRMHLINFTAAHLLGTPDTR